MKRLVLFCAFLLLVPALGCSSNQTLRDSWKYTQRQYRTYLNVPAELDYDATGNCTVYELALGDAMLEVDNALLKLIRAMENSDRGPDQAWVMKMMQSFPWLTGVALADNTGAVMARYPEHFMKEFNVTPLLEQDPKQRRNALRAYVQESPMGPEVYLANPVYVGEDFRGLVTVYFDPRALMSLSNDPGNVMLATPFGVIWHGRFTGTATAVDRTDWAALLQQKSCGLVGEKGDQFYWTTRYLGNMPLVYAFPVAAVPAVERAEKPDESAAPAEQPEQSASPSAQPEQSATPVKEEHSPAPAAHTPAAEQPAKPENPQE